MSVWDDLKGQDTAVELLRRSAARGRLAHGYAFFGPGGVGKRLAARLMAQCLFCPEVPDAELDACGTCPSCKQMRAGNHPDFLAVAKPPGKRELPIDLIAGAKERRGREGLNHEIAMRPMTAGRRFAVVDDADAMNAESANALLKTLEEPPAGAVLVLIARGPEAVLPTINSRVQPLHFAPLSDDVLASLLVDQEVPRGEAEAVAKVAGGSLETATQLLEGDVKGLRGAAKRAFAEEPFHAVASAAAVNKVIDDLGGDAAAKRVQAEWAVRFLVEELRAAARAVTLSGELPDGLKRQLPADAGDAVEVLSEMVERCVACERAVAGMTPVPLAVEGLFDDLSALLRRADRPVLEMV